MRRASRPSVFLRFVLILLAAFGAAAQTPSVDGKRVTDIQYTPADVLHPDDLAKLQVVKKGSFLRQGDVADTIDRLFSTGRFEDIVAEADVTADGVVLRFVTTPAYFVGGVSVEGKLKEPPNRGEIASISRLQIGTLFREEDLQRATTRIKRLLTSNGLYEAELKPEVRHEANGQQVFVTFHVKENKRAKYDMPTFKGDSKLSDSTILRATGWRIPLIHWWRQVTDSRTRKGVQRVLAKYQKQERLTAKVSLEKLDYDAKRRRVRPTLNINPGPKVEVKAVEAKVKRGTLKRYVPIFQEQTVDNDLLVEGARNLRDYFQSRGYYDVDVDFRVRPPENDLQVIEYVIAQGQRYRLVDIAFAGNRYFDAETFRERMFLQTGSFLQKRGRYSEAFRKRDEETISSLYKANGFRDAKVNAVTDRNHGGKTGNVGVTIQINEGEQWTVESMEVNGITQLDRESLLSRLASQVGQPFAEVNMAADRSFILTAYYTEGFPETDFRASWQPGSAPNRVKVIYTVVEGKRQYVRGVLTSGFKITRPALVEKRITMQPGDPLSPTEQSEIQKRFYDMGVFARVDAAVQNAEGETDHKYVIYNFEEANRYSLSIGLGAQVGRFGTPSSSDLSAPGGSTGFSPLISMNLSRLNFLGLGHTVSLRGVYSNLQKRGSISYTAPRFRDVAGRNFTATLLYDNSLDVRTFASRRQEASVQVSQQLSKSSTAIFRLAYRRVSVSDVVIPTLLVPQLVQPVRLGLVSANFVQDRRDNAGDPRRGVYNTADVTFATRYLASQRNFTRMLLRNATYHRITRTIVLARQTQFGWIAPFSAPEGLTDQQSVPLPERFFGGGADSLRAFPFNQAGPRDVGAPAVPGADPSQPTGFPLGGNALLFNNVELRFPFLGSNMQGVLFHDMGNVYSTIGDMSFRMKQRDLNDFNYTVHSAGFGVRYKTPVGPIRLDLAYSINPPAYLGFSGSATELLQCNPNLPPSQLPSFCQSTRQNVSHFQFFFSIGQTF